MTISGSEWPPSDAGNSELPCRVVLQALGTASLELARALDVVRIVAPAVGCQGSFKVLVR